jgi:hypothetical protein
MNVRPGDLIEWVYRRDGRPVREDEYIWSSIEREWVPIGSSMTHLCVSRDGKTITWLNERGVFRARGNDGNSARMSNYGVEIIPRARE